MNEETFLSDFQLEFTPPQPHNINLNTPTTSSGNSSSSEEEDGPPIQIVPLDNPLPNIMAQACLLYTSPSPRDKRQSRMPSSA